jgi:hypothetical protein
MELHPPFEIRFAVEDARRPGPHAGPLPTAIDAAKVAWFVGRGRIKRFG